jgi:two-component system chemotaxis response regulator CheY
MAFNILIVDDSETMRTVIKRTVGMTGIGVGELLEAGNGKEAMAILADAWIDVVLSDINMPEMGGIELLKKMKEDPVLQNIPVIFISTESSHARMDEAKELGVAAYVKKPFTPEKIKEVMLDVLNKAYASRMNEIKEESSIELPDDDMEF